MLDGFLQHTLNLTVGIAHLTGQESHLAHIHLAESQKDGYHNDDDYRQELIHGEEIEEGAEEKRQDAQGTWNSLGKEAYHLRHIPLKPVEHITRMKALPTLPLRAKDAVEHTLLHTVLRLDAQEVSYPDARDVECEIA